MDVATSAAMRNIDRRVIETYRVPGIVLMENAGLELLRFILRHWPDRSQTRVVIIVGPGNNGGDGFILSRHLWSRGFDVQVALLTSASRLRGDARRAYAMARAYEVPLISCATTTAWCRFAHRLGHFSVIVDALLGTGLHRPADGLFATVIEDINAAARPVVSVDIPSGLSADDSLLLGPCVQATYTVTFALPKPALIQYPAAVAVGALKVVDIGIPPQAIAAERLDIAWLQASDIASVLPMRQVDSHKGTHGHILVVAGSTGKAGAAALTSRSALRGGAGLVTLAIPASLNHVMELGLTEVMTLPLPATPSGSLTVNALPGLMALLPQVNAIVLGPGLGMAPETVGCVYSLLRASVVPIVLDADGLNAVAMQLDVLHDCHCPVIMTPHPGEMSRLLGVSTAHIQSQRLDIARDFARTYGVYLVLKGAGTVIVTPEGQRYINSTGNPAMATAGSGDVLAGLIGALLGQGLAPLAGTQCGVYIHGLAGDRIRNRQGSSGLLASDIVDELPYATEAIIRAHRLE